MILKKKKVKFGYLQSIAELIRRYCLPLRKLHVLNICRKKERSFVRSFFYDEMKITQYTLLLVQNMLMAKLLFSNFITFLKWEIHPYFVNLFKVSVSQLRKF